MKGSDFKGLVATGHSDDFGTFKCGLKVWGIKKKVFTRMKIDGLIISKSEQEKNVSIFRISGDLGRGPEMELGQQVLSGGGAACTRTGPFRGSPSLNGATFKAKACTSALEEALELLSFLVLFGPVCNMAHPALAPGCPPHPPSIYSLLQLFFLTLYGRFLSSQRLHTGQFTQLFCQVRSRRMLGAGLGLLFPGRPPAKAATDAAVRAVEMAANVLRGQIPQTFGLGIWTSS